MRMWAVGLDLPWVVPAPEPVKLGEVARVLSSPPGWLRGLRIRVGAGIDQSDHWAVSWRSNPSSIRPAHSKWQMADPAMATQARGRDRLVMIMARIGIRSRNGERVFTRTVELGDGYGKTAELAHEFLTFALTAASKPVVVDQGGAIHRIPRKRLAFVAVWASGGTKSGLTPPAVESRGLRACARKKTGRGPGIGFLPGLVSSGTGAARPRSLAHEVLTIARAGASRAGSVTAVNERRRGSCRWRSIRLRPTLAV